MYLVTIDLFLFQVGFSVSVLKARPLEKIHASHITCNLMTSLGHCASWGTFKAPSVLGGGLQLYLGICIEEGIDLHCCEIKNCCKKVFSFDTMDSSPENYRCWQHSVLFLESGSRFAERTFDRRVKTFEAGLLWPRDVLIKDCFEHRNHVFTVCVSHIA